MQLAVSDVEEGVVPLLNFSNHESGFSGVPIRSIFYATRNMSSPW
jgi:hypothetical protein